MYLSQTENTICKRTIYKFTGCHRLATGIFLFKFLTLLLLEAAFCSSLISICENQATRNSLPNSRRYLYRYYYLQEQYHILCPIQCLKTCRPVCRIPRISAISNVPYRSPLTHLLKIIVYLQEINKPWRLGDQLAQYVIPPVPFIHVVLIWFSGNIHFRHILQERRLLLQWRIIEQG